MDYPARYFEKTPVVDPVVDVDHALPALHQTPLAPVVDVDHQQVALAAERAGVVYVPGAYGQMVPVSREQAELLLRAVQPTPVRDLTPQPLLDAQAQRTVAKGVSAGAAAAGIGWGVGEVVSAAAGISTGAVLALAGLVVAGRALGARQTVTNHTNVTIHNRWFGRSGPSTINHR